MLCFFIYELYDFGVPTLLYEICLVICICIASIRENKMRHFADHIILIRYK